MCFHTIYSFENKIEAYSMIALEVFLIFNVDDNVDWLKKVKPVSWTGFWPTKKNFSVAFLCLEADATDEEFLKNED